MCYRYNSRCQLIDCLAHRVVEVVQLFSSQSSVESGANLGAGQPEFDIIHLVDQVLLGVFQFTMDVTERQKVTYSDHCKDNNNGTESSPGWCVARDFLREIEDFDEPI